MTADTEKQPHPEAFEWTFNHPDGLPHTETRDVEVGAPRVHLSGDPEGGWIGEIHDGEQNFSASTEHTDAQGALEHLHRAWQEAGNAAIEAWDEIVDDARKAYRAARQKAADAAATAERAARAAQQASQQGQNQQGGGQPQ